MATDAERIVAACEKAWDANKSDCSAFVRAVGKALNIPIMGNADDIMVWLSSSAAWESLRDGPAAAAAAEQGRLAIGGLTGPDHDPPRSHGHVVIVVSGSLNKNKYPTAYWGMLGGVGKKNSTLNWAWSEKDRNNIKYFSRSLP